MVETADGKCWRQRRYHYEYRYAYRPSVTIVDGSEGVMMTVDDMDPVEVEPVSCSHLKD